MWARYRVGGRWKKNKSHLLLKELWVSWQRRARTDASLYKRLLINDSVTKTWEGNWSCPQSWNATGLSSGQRTQVWEEQVRIILHYPLYVPWVGRRGKAALPPLGGMLKRGSGLQQDLCPRVWHLMCMPPTQRCRASAWCPFFPYGCHQGTGRKVTGTFRQKP